MSFHLLAISAGQGDISQLSVTSKFTKESADIFLEFVPLETELFRGNHHERRQNFLVKTTNENNLGRTSAVILLTVCTVFISLGVRSIEHPNVLSEKINFSAPGGPKSGKFEPGHLDSIYFEVGNFSA